MRAFGSAYANSEASIGGDYKKLPAGGYIIGITDVRDMPAKEYLQVVFDIVEGPYRGFYSDTWGAAHPYAHSMYKSYKPENMKYFKGFIACIDKSNGTNFGALYSGQEAVNERLLIGKRLGVIIGYEEYVNDQGEVRERSYVVQNRSIDGLEKCLRDVRDGKEKIPEVKPLKFETPSAEPAPAFKDLKTDDIPF